MPVHVERRAGKFRVIEPSGAIASTPLGNARDGGGHVSKERADRQARAINASLHKAAMQTLYVSRRLLNTADFTAWAASQGFASITPAAHLHVTIAFSRAKVSWEAMGEAAEHITAWQRNHRGVERLGDKGAVVLKFKSAQLAVRHNWLKAHGCSWDWPDYNPHVTITYDAPTSLDLDLITPFNAPLRFGPEVFREVVEDWETKIVETQLA